MFSLFRPFIFKLDPELAHNLAIKALKTNILPSAQKKHKFENLNSSFLGKKISNPIGLAAGFDKDAEVYNSMYKLGFSFVEVGTVTPKSQYGNPKPRMFRLEKDRAIINRLGFNNVGSEIIINRIKNNPAEGILGINIGPNSDSKNRINDYLICLKTFYEVSDYITINISSPNTKNLRSFHNKAELNDLMKALNDEKINLNTNVPLVIKISPDIDNSQIDIISDTLLNSNISAIIISNTSEKNRDNLISTYGVQKGGISGKPLEEKSNFLIKEFYNIFKGKIKIIGVGGVDSGKSAFQKFLNGADLIQLYTGMIYKGPNIANKINSELNEIFKKDGIKNLSEIIGNKS
tara:strand:+ start:19 stop:1062 length:1044 start_codon:yes stop_codon:yes gene_type:complete